MSDAHPTTLFDKILSGDIPCHRVYEDEHVLAFLDIGPLSPGHTLVIPKEPKAHLHELSDESAAALGRALPRICRAVLRATGATDYNVLQNNGAAAHQVVMHVHFHVIPKLGSKGLGIGWPAGKLDDGEARDLLSRLRTALAEDSAGEGLSRMQAVEICGAFGLENLTLVERPDPVPGPGEILLAMRAAALNYRDLLMVRGLYNRRQPLPLVPCSDGVGEVVAIGAGVTRVAVGDRVCATFFQRWAAGRPTKEGVRSTLGGPLDGTLAERMVLSEEGVVRVPAHLTDEEAATLPCAALTAWNALVTEGRLAAGETVLIQGTGGVSLFALQIAVLAGARAIVTSSSDEKLARVRALGAAAGINYRETPEWGAKAKELTDGVGVDHVVEVGGAATLEQSLRAVRVGGTVSLIGNLSGTTPELALTLVFMQRVRLQGILVGDRESFEAMNRAIGAARLRPIVDRTFPLEEARAAFDHLAAAKAFGKIAVALR